MTETAAAVVTYLFSDIESSTRLWEQEPAERMRAALARHDALCKAAVARHHGRVVKMTGDGVHAAFDDPAAALRAMLEIQIEISAPTGADPTDAPPLELRLRCGLHLGADQRRDNDYFGPAVNRAARIMSAAHGGQMLISQAVADRVAAALPDGVRLRDLGTARLRDLLSPERLYQVLHPALRQDFPPLRSLEGTPNNLTQQLNSFIGRERELAEIKQMLARSRLLALLGMGGIGKSRLSVQLAADVLDDYPDGVWFVELAPLTDPRSVPQALASVLGVKEEAGRPVIEALVKYVRDKQLLIVLDNCEHVIHACAELAKALLQAGPRVKVLASSRDYLQIAGEVTYHVPTLSTPEPGDKIAIDVLTQHEAVRLFVDRATATQPAFAITQKNAAAVADICHRLDGIPLAIELAAARTRAMSVEVISERLSDRFRLLVTGDKTVLPRQRTLRALVDWSYDLLSEPERTLFQRLSVFAGGWTLEAAEAVCAGEGLEAADVLDLLAQLVEKSLVTLDPHGGRYRMLDTVRHYGAEKLRREEAITVRNRHLEHYLNFAVLGRPELAGPKQGEWLTRFDADWENLRSAHAWCDTAKSGSELGLRLIFALRPYWMSRGLLGLGYGLAVEALRRAGAQDRNNDRRRALFDAGQIAYFLGLYGDARSLLEQSLSIAKDLVHTRGIAVVLQPLGMACIGQGDLGSARAYLADAVNLAGNQNDNRELASALNAYAMLCRVEGKLEEAQVYYRKALTLARQIDDVGYVAIFALNLAMISLNIGDKLVTRDMLIEAVSIASDTMSIPITQCTYDVVAALAIESGDFKTGCRFIGLSEALLAKASMKRDRADSEFIETYVEQARYALGEQRFESIVAAGNDTGLRPGLTEAETWLKQCAVSRS